MSQRKVIYKAARIEPCPDGSRLVRERELQVDVSPGVDGLKDAFDAILEWTADFLAECPGATLSGWKAFAAKRWN